MKKKLLSTVLAVCLLLGLLPGTAWAALPSGYTTDSNGIMAYKEIPDSAYKPYFDIKGCYGTDWLDTTYNSSGYLIRYEGLNDASVTHKAEFTNGGRYVKVTYTVTAGSAAISGGKLAICADIQIGLNDSAAVSVIQNASGKVIGLKMINDTMNFGKGAQFNLYFDGTGGVTPVDTYWFGKSIWRGYRGYDQLSDSTVSSDATESNYTKDANGVYTQFSNADSAATFSWNVDLAANESKTFSFLVGVGAMADPPVMDKDAPISLTTNIAAADNGRTVDVSASVTDADGLTDTLYYSVDGGAEQEVGHVTADGTAKDITGQISLLGLGNGTHTLAFWVVNSAGALSPSVTREVTVSTDGVGGLDTPPTPPEAKWGVGSSSLTGSGTLAEALAAAAGGNAAYVQLQDDVTAAQGATFTASAGTFTLDLNGHTLTGGNGKQGGTSSGEASSNYPLTVAGATVTLTNTKSEEGGGITGGNGGYYAISGTDYNKNGGGAVEVQSGSLTLEGGVTLTVGNPCSHGANEPSGTSILYITGGAVTLKGGTYDCTAKTSGSITQGPSDAICIAHADATLTIPATATGLKAMGKYGVNANAGTVSIAAGTFEGTNYGIYASNKAPTVTISGGTFTGGTNGLHVNVYNGTTVGEKVNLSGGTYTATGTSGSAVGSPVSDYTLMLASGYCFSADGTTKVAGSAIKGAKTLTVIETPPHSHTFSDGWAYDNAGHWHACTAEGCTIEDYSACGETDAAYAAHTPVTDAAKAPTCTATGLTEGSHCSVCNAVLVAQETVDALGHDWGNWTITKAPTETETGTAERSCTKDTTHKDTATLPALTDTTVWTEDTKVEPTEDADGSQTYTSDYGTVTVTLPKLEHTHAWGDWTITKAPTETETGTAERSCTKDSTHKDTSTLPALTDATVWTPGTKVEPTETADGSQEYRSDYGTVTVTLPKLEHNHTWAADWSADDTHHWKTCSGCSEKNGYAQHTKTWDKNASQHWQKCDTCGWADSTKADHSYTDDQDATCNTCDYTRALVPVITTTSLPAGERGSRYYQALAATGDTPITWSVTQGDLPGGLTLESGVIHGTPTAAGTFTFTVGATNGAGTATKELTITVKVPFAITTASLPGGTVGTAYSAQMECEGAPDPDNVRWSIATNFGSDKVLPDGLTISDAGLISGTPTRADSFVFFPMASSGGKSATMQFTITVSEPAPPEVKWGADAEHLGTSGTLAEALAAAADGAAYIQLQGDVTAAEGATFTANTGTFTLDLSGHTLTGGKGADDGTPSNAEGGTGLEIHGANVTLKNGTVTGGTGGHSDLANDMNGNGGKAVCVSSGALTVESGVTLVVGDPGTGRNGTPSGNVALEVRGGAVILNGGTFDSDAKMEGGVTKQSAGYAISVQNDQATLTVPAGASVAATGKRGITITGCREVTIAAGSYTGTQYGMYVNTSGTVKLSGGTFSGTGNQAIAGASDTLALLADGYCFSADGTTKVESNLSREKTLHVIATPAPATHIHAVDGGEGSVEFQPFALDQFGRDNATSGHFYLTENITTTKDLFIDADVDLCLNGYTLTFTNNFVGNWIDVGHNQPATVNICDCSADHSGAISGMYKTLNLYNARTSFTLHSGTLEVRGGTGSSNSYALEIKDATANLLGGTLRSSASGDNTAYGVYMTDGAVLNLSGATVSATGTDTDGYAIFLGGGMVNLSGGSLTATGKSAKGVYMSGGTTLRLSGEPVISATIQSTGSEGPASTSAISVPKGSTLQASDSEGNPYTGAVLTVSPSGDRAAGDVVVIGVSDENAGKFVSTHAVYTFARKDDTLVLADPNAPSPGHTHTMQTGDTWTYDGTNHWHQCTDPDCPDLAGSKADVTPHTKTWVNTDPDQHWQKCDTCGWANSAKADHSYTDDTDTTCNTCGYERTVIPPTPEHVHSWTEAWAKNDTHHWHECTVSGCTVTENSGKDGYAAHTTTWDKDATQHWQKCDTCGWAGTKADHTWNGGEVTQSPTAAVEGVKTYTCTTCSATKTEAIPVLTFDVSGKVQDSENTAVAGATVKLMQGKNQIAVTTTDSGGDYCFTNVPAGSYNVVATKDGKTMTILVTVTDANQTGQNLKMPSDNVNSVLDVKDASISGAAADVSKIVVGGLEKEAEENKETGKTVTVTMTVEAKEETDADLSDEITAIKAQANQGGATETKKIDFLEIKVEKKVETVGGTSDPTTEAITTTTNLLEIIIPFDSTGKTDIAVYRYHGSSVNTLGTTANSNGEYITVDTDSITLHVKNFSTYAIGYTETAADTYTVTVQTDGHGTASASPTSATQNTEITLTATADSGYRFQEWQVVSGGVTITDNKFTMPATNVTVKAIFEYVGGGSSGGSGTTYYTITASANEGGKIDPSGSVRVRRSSDKTFTITPNEGYVIADVLVDGVSVGAVSEYTFETVTKAHTIEASFQKADTVADCSRDAACPAYPFTDLNLKAWYHDGIHFCVERELMVGTSETTFEPETPTSRAMIATILWRLQGSKVVNYAMQYDDVAEGTWYAEAVRWATSEGIVEGYGNGSFGPDDPITREQLATMLWRFAGSPESDASLDSFTDGGKAGSWAVDALKWAVEQGIVTGKGNGTLDPTGAATRAEAATMIQRFCQRIK